MTRASVAVGVVSMVWMLLSPGQPTTTGVAAAPAQTTWTFDRLDSIGGLPTRVEGHPRVIESPVGAAVEFNGVDDAVFIDANPLAGASTFTFEAIFRPDGGDFAQRWFHLAERDAATGRLVTEGSSPTVDANARILFEIRTREGQWWLDAFVNRPDSRSTLLLEDKKHPVGTWYHVAQTYDGKMHRSYVNGVLQGEAALTGFKAMGPGAASVGTRINRVSYFKGAVRLARFTPRALTPDQFVRIGM